MNLNFIFQALDGTGDAGNLSGTSSWGISNSYCVQLWSSTINTIYKSGSMHHDAAKECDV